MSFVFIWTTHKEAPAVVRDVVASIDGVLDLYALLTQRRAQSATSEYTAATRGAWPPAGVASEAAVAAPELGRRDAAPWYARLVGVVCYLDNHWVVFIDTGETWICCNDERVFTVAYPLSEVIRFTLQPSILFYQVDAPGESVAAPADRGRSRLLSPADLATAGAAPHVPMAVALAHGDARVSLSSSTEFPALGGRSGGAGTAPPRTWVAAAPVPPPAASAAAAPAGAPSGTAALSGGAQ